MINIFQRVFRCKGIRCQAWLLGCGTSTLTCTSSSLRTAKLVLHEIRSSFGGSCPQLLLRQGSNLEFLRGSVEASPPCFESACAFRDSIHTTLFAQPCELMVGEQPCEPIIVERPCEPMQFEQRCEPTLVQEPGSVALLPVLEVFESGGEEDNQERGIEVQDANFPRNGETDVSESYPAARCVHSTKNVVLRDTSLAVEAGSAGELTEVQIGSAVEGEDEDGLACYRSWKSVKRGFSQIAPEDLGCNGIGSGGSFQGLLDSELGCMTLTKRQKVHVESLSCIDFENGCEGKDKDLSLEEYEVTQQNALINHADKNTEVNGDKITRSVDTKEFDSALPRVNLLKLRKCSSGKGGWRVAGNSCIGDCGEPLTPTSIADRKRSFSQCFEINQSSTHEKNHSTDPKSKDLESPEENGRPISFVETSYFSGHETANADGTEKVKVNVKGLWSNCEVSSLKDTTFNPRKRFKNASRSSGSSDDSYASHSKAQAYPSKNLTDHFYPDSVCQGCMANVLVVLQTMGWREYGATIELQPCLGQGWMLVISVRGENMYAYKAEQAIVTGTTNRYNHAVVWKGGKGWSLEFDDKKQWHVFKEMHEECYQRNAKSSSMRQIPIPGARRLEDIVPRSPGCNFIRPYSRYICGFEDEVEMAMRTIVYDMDSEDEQWLTQINTERASARGTRTRPLIAEETLERLMDKLEKDAYLYQQEHQKSGLNPNDVAAESCTGLATQEVINAVYGYWSEKRTRKGMPLVRHFQPPAWEQYQRQVKLWEQEIAGRMQQQPSASMQQLTEDVRKPPLFAFCLRPRGLEAQHKLSKQKSHRKQTLPGTASRQWVGLGSLDGSLQSLGKRQHYTEPANGLPPGPRRPGRPRLTQEVRADLTGSFNAIMREPSVRAGGVSSMEFLNNSLIEYAQRRAGKNKKVGRKARRQRLLAAAQESRRKRLLMRNMGSAERQQQPDLAFGASWARSIAEAARARAQALYAVADAAMHKAVAAVIAADALHATGRQESAAEHEPPVGGVDFAVGPTFGSWRRGVIGSAPAGSAVKGSASRHGLESDGEDALLPVASWSQELGAGLGTRLLNKDAEMEGLISSRIVQADCPLLNAEFGSRGESMVST